MPGVCWSFLLGDLYRQGEMSSLHDERTPSCEWRVLSNLRESAINELSLIGGYRSTEKGFVIDILYHETFLFTKTIVTSSGTFRNV